MNRLIFFFLLAGSSACFSQTHSDRSAILEIGYGVAAPFGKFESIDVNDSASGFATAGTNLNVLFTYLVNKRVGIAAMISSSVNRLNESGTKNKFQVFADRIPGTVSDMQLAKWSTMAYMAGAYLTYPMKKASFNFQVLAGYSRTEYPEADVTIFKDTIIDPVVVNQSASGVASAFCFNAGAGIKYNISEIMCLSVNANFFSSYPEFENVMTEAYINGDRYEEFHKVHQRISLLNVTAGVGFRF
jgi:hypothetical protein